MDFGDTSCVLALVIRQDDAGKLTGMVSSLPPPAQFSLPVRGEIEKSAKPRSVLFNPTTREGR